MELNLACQTSFETIGIWADAEILHHDGRRIFQAVGDGGHCSFVAQSQPLSSQQPCRTKPTDGACTWVAWHNEQTLATSGKKQYGGPNAKPHMVGATPHMVTLDASLDSIKLLYSPLHSYPNDWKRETSSK